MADRRYSKATREKNTEREAVENAAPLDVNLSQRISRDVDDALNDGSSEEQISPSARPDACSDKPCKPRTSPSSPTPGRGDCPTHPSRLDMTPPPARRSNTCRALLAPEKTTNAQVQRPGHCQWRCLSLTRTPSAAG